MVWQIVRDNIRASDLVVGDMDAQVAAARIGAERMAELVERYGLETFDLACTALMDHAERLMRQAIARLPDGVYRAETAIDGYLDSDDPAKKELPIVVTITKKDDFLVVDLTGTAPQVPDRPINMPLEGTADIAIWLTIRSVLLDTEIHGHIPVNAGLIRPITIIAPKGCLANPTFPAPTIARFCPGNQLADTVMKALSAAMPGNVSAGIGNLKVIAFSGLKDETHWVHMEIFEGSYGGRLGKDGMDAVDTLYANTRNNPIEDIETHLPLRVLRYELREDVAGAGKWRGGLGSVREFTFLSDGGASVEGEGHRYRPWGFLGGSEGMPAKLDLVVPAAPTRALPSKVPHMNVAKDGRFVCYGPAGGGYGNPLERDPAQGRRRRAGRRDLGRDGAQGLRRRGVGERRGGPGRGRRSNVRREPRADRGGISSPRLRSPARRPRPRSSVRRRRPPPSCDRCCRSFTAASVFGLNRPSTPPVSKPTALMRLCSRRTGSPLDPTRSTGSLWSASSMLIHVTRPTIPSTAISRACWKALTALVVLAPKAPSIGPGSCPSALRAC